MDLFGTAPIVWIQSLFGPGWEAPFRAVTVLGSTWGLILVAGLAFWLWGRGPLYGILALAAVEAVVKLAIASVTAVPRPSGAGVIKYESIEAYTSFPSGHVSSATAVWSFLGFLRRIPLAVGVGIGVLVGVTRLYLGVHWLVDVLAGLAIGLLLAWLVSRGQDPLVERAQRVPAAIWFGAGLLLVVVATAGAVWGIGTAPPQWTAVGFLGGLGVAVPVERRWIRYAPRSPGLGPALFKVVVGWGGISLCLWWARSGGDEALLRHALMAFAATLWALLGAPLVFSAVARPPERRRREP